MKKPRIRVVEMFNSEKNRWEPTVGVGLWASDSRAEVRTWREENPDDKFRVSIYERVKP